uniref:Uncharacterized protein n=1 Tax=Nelumbo nucifera TaxID=4432 RepID=A0A822ZUN8_NELNU|nr:TPA_asm: hypothetical protein HUJ06_016513 [Nelumbo nucifera]
MDDRCLAGLRIQLQVLRKLDRLIPATLKSQRDRNAQVLEDAGIKPNSDFYSLESNPECSVLGLSSSAMSTHPVTIRSIKITCAQRFSLHRVPSFTYHQFSFDRPVSSTFVESASVARVYFPSQQYVRNGETNP